MAINPLPKTFQVRKSEINYLNKDFSQIKQSLIDFSKTYFPQTYKDFSDSSPGMMFIEMASYVGDVLSYYIDYQFKEGLLNYSEERKNVIALANYLGYQTKPVKPSITDLELFHIVPSLKNSDGSFSPDLKYSLKIKDGMSVIGSNNIPFLTTEEVNFEINTVESPRQDTIYSYDSQGNPQFYLLRKTVKAYSGQIVQKTFNVGDATPFLKLYLDESNVIQILSIRDSDNNPWYQVDYLAQELIPNSIENSRYVSSEFYQYRSTVPYILNYIKTSNRFTVNVDHNNKTFLQFGPGVDGVQNELVVLNSESIGVGFSNLNANVSLDPSNFLKTNSLGVCPYNTTLTVTYVVGGGILSNTNVDDLRRVVSVEYNNNEHFNESELQLFNLVKSSLRVNNYTPATGGADEESVDQIRQNALSYFSSQNRTVTRDDYIVRAYSMPKNYGSLAKVYVDSESGLMFNNVISTTGLLDSDNNIIIDEKNKNFRKLSLDTTNPMAINMYVLAYDSNKNLTGANKALVYNLKNYLAQNRMLSDRINIIDGYIVNIGVDFKVIVYGGYNKREVLGNCITAVKNFFNIDLWGFSQPININQLQLEIANVEGVQSIAHLNIKNLTTNDGVGYSPCEYDIAAATSNNIIYPSIDPSVFEIKYPDTDIRASGI